MVQTYSLQAVMAGYPSGSYICHHGIKGQKWGVRRYQNPDGTLTEEGKKRYGKYLDRYHDEQNAFSTQSSAKKTFVTTFGTAGASMALAGAGLVAGTPAFAIASAAASAGAAVNHIVQTIRREKARRFMEKTGQETVEKMQDDRKMASYYSGWGGNLIALGINHLHVRRMQKKKAKEALSEVNSDTKKKPIGQMNDDERAANLREEYKNATSKEQKKILKQAMSKKYESPVDFSKYKTEIKNAKTKAEADAIINKIVKETMAEGDKLMKKYTFKTAPETNDALYYRYQPDFIVDDILTRYPSLKF